MAATHTIIKHRRDTVREVSGTVEELIENFRYTLEAGNSYNSKISTQPKTIKSLVSALNKSVDVLQVGSYNPDYYEIG